MADERVGIGEYKTLMLECNRQGLRDDEFAACALHCSPLLLDIRKTVIGNDYFQVASLDFSIRSRAFKL